MSVEPDSSASEKSPGVPEQPIRVLVVDDEPALRQTYEAILTDHGCTVRSASNGRKALQVLMQQSFDVMIVDLKMDEMDGIVFLQEALKIWPWIGVIIISAYITDDVIPKAAEMGVTRILEKPVTLKMLCDNVDAEAAVNKEEDIHIPHNNALDLMRDHLRILADLGYKSVGAQALVHALADFGRSLADMMPSDVVGILVADNPDEAPTLFLHVHTRVADEFLTSIRDEVFERYTTLSGRELDKDSLILQVDGVARGDDGPQQPGSTLSVPVILSNEICGLVTLATSQDKKYSASDVSLLYHAANHISVVFMTLRRMHRLATRDPLTGIYNRIRLEEELERTWLISRRYGSSMGVVVVDIDNFKTLNDSYGHSVGDEVLRDFARVLQSVSRGTDIIARYGGDEFIAILPQAGEDAVRSFGTRLLESTRRHTFCETRHRLNLTISIGMATSLNPSRPSTGTALLSQADRALYMAKRAGRDRMCMWPGQGAAQPADSDADEKKTAQLTAKENAHILVVDDEPSICSLTEVMLSRDGYKVTTCGCATDAVEIVKKNPDTFAILLTDICLPDRSGIEVLHDVVNLSSMIVPIVMTGNATVDSAVSCLREGAYDFIEKPLSRAQLLALVERALEYRQLKLDNARYQSHLENLVTERSEQLASSLEEIKRSYEFTLEALVAMLDAREHLTGRHSIRTQDLAVTLALKMGLSGEELETVAIGALLHDIGKIAIRDEILLKPGPLLPDEWDIMKKHPEIGYEILRSSPYLRDAAQIVYQHQEHYNGSGYPRQLKAEHICIGARIFGVIDAYDAMRSERVYRSPVTPEEARAEIRRNSGTQFDPEVVRAFEECQDELEQVIANHEEQVAAAAGRAKARRSA